MSIVIAPPETIGILGGGQLGRMMAIAAKEMGYRVAVLEPTTDSPCGQVSDTEFVAQYDDKKMVEQLAEASAVITYEFENIDREMAKILEEKQLLPQGYKLLETTQHRLREKEAITSLGLPVAPFVAVSSAQDVMTGIQKLGLPAVLKTCTGGYDGKGQVVIKEEQEAEAAFATLSGAKELVLEQWIPFEKEVSVIVVRSTKGEVKTFPVAENIHVNNILHQSIVPARLDTTVLEKAEQLALTLAKGMNMVGTLAVEMFVTKDGEIFVNELAPRPHNSGHYTLNACETSQFEQHVRAICGLPLGSTELLKPVVMVNILGEHMPKMYEALEQFSNVKLHLYGKVEAKTGRKMGHVNILAESVEEALKKSDELGIW